MRLWIAALVATVCVLGLSANVSAHSGRTDSYGGHNCYVGSCAGTYHYHNGGYRSYTPTVDYYSEGKTAGAAKARAIRTEITQRAKTSGYNNGYNDKSMGYFEKTLPAIAYDVCNYDFTYTSSTSFTYKTGYQAGFDKVCELIARETYRTNYATGYSIATTPSRDYLPVASSTNASTSSYYAAAEEDDYGWVWWVVVLGGLGLYGAAADSKSKS